MKQDKKKLAYATGDGIDRDCWFTPPQYIEMAREVMGAIDLDPYSSDEAQETVKATEYFTAKRNRKCWIKMQARVWMNPPYGRGKVEEAVDAFTAHLERGSISQGVVLVNNATETRWFQKLLSSASAICLPNKRIAFISRDGKSVSGNTRGQVFFYFGHNVSRFKSIFGEIGGVLTCDSNFKN